MFLSLSKTLDYALAPMAWAFALALAALLLRRRRVAWVLAAAALAMLWAFSTNLVASGLSRLAERPAVRTQRPGVVYDAVVVLSGVVDDDASRLSGQVELLASAERFLAGYDVLRAGEARLIVLSGVSPEPAPEDRPEPERLSAELRAWGVPAERIVLELRSRNTHENAEEVARLASDRGWRTLLLVTSAAHMPRALGCFRRAGLAPDALPVDHRAAQLRGLLPRAAALQESTEVLHELAGRVVYRLMGYL